MLKNVFINLFWQTHILKWFRRNYVWVVFIFIDNLAMGDGERVLSDNYTETFIIVGPLCSSFFFFLIANGNFVDYGL